MLSGCGFIHEEIVMKCCDCDGEGDVRVYCSYCNGSGEGRHETQKCFNCGGKGEIRVYCRDCDGTGEVEDEE